MYVKIEKKRMEMIQVVKKYGLSSMITIQCSQELDKLLNDFYSIQKNNYI